MRALSDQRAAELAKPFDNEEVQDQPENPASEIQTQETNTYVDPLENFTAQSQDPAPQSQPQTQNIYPEPTTPTYNTPALQTTQPQGASYVELIEDKSAQLKEKWSIALGFGILPVGFTAIF